jgi:hypothetical protein
MQRKSMSQLSNPATVVHSTIPGPDRKHTAATYVYRVVYWQRASEPGCRLMWEVTGGRMPYQIAVEQTERGKLRWHCTCADAIFRGEKEANHQCKHIRGLMDSTLIDPNPASASG